MLQESVIRLAGMSDHIESESVITLPKNTHSDHVDDYLIEIKVDSSDYPILKDAVLRALQRAFYNSTDEERQYFRCLSATYTLLFCLNTEPRIVQYFQDMAADFTLLVGSDILIRALSERYLRPEDQLTRNTLRLIKDAGGSLVLTEPVLDEVASHIVASVNEFENHYQPIEQHLDLVIARNSDRILIRAYFYSKLQPPEGITGPRNWRDYINQFCDYGHVRSREGKEQIRRYLIAQFEMSYETRETLASLCDSGEVDSLALSLKAEKKDERLAENDALLTLAIYGRRKSQQEHSSVSEFGYKTWWLTAEARILRHTDHLVKGYGARYMMRPEFLLNFITLAPSVSEVRRAYRETFPSVLGLRLSRRIESSELKKVLRKVAQATELDPGRREATISQLSDKLKGDFLRPYAVRFKSKSD